MSEEAIKTETAEVPAAVVAPAKACASPRSGVSYLALLFSLAALSLAAVPLYQAQQTSAPQPGLADKLAQVETLVQDNALLKHQIEVLQQRLDEAEARVAALPVTVSAPSGPPVDLKPLENRLAALEARPAGGDTHALEKAIAELRQEVSGETQTQDAQKTLMVATLQLISAWQSGQSFEASWLAAQAAATSVDPALELELADAAPLLLPWRDKGVPSLAQLTADYPDMAQQVVAAAVKPGEGWWQQTLGRVKGLVVVRRQGESVSADDTAVDAVLARAETQLKTGDLASAVEELEKLDGDTAAPAADWLSAARARLRVDALSAHLTQRAAGALLPANAAAAPADSDLPNDDSAVDSDAPGEAP